MNFQSLNKLSILLILVTALLTGCQKAPINGHLDGQWQVMDVSPAPKDIIIKERLYYAFYMHTCMLTYYGGGNPGNGNFIYENNTLQIDFPYLKSQNDSIILSQYGVNSNPVTFTILELNKKTMVLKDGETIVTMRKF